MMSELKYNLSRWWSKVYYPVRDFFFPWNVIKLRNLDRSWSDVDARMEEVIFQLLVDFFNGEQPFHLQTGTPYEKNKTLTIDRHRELLAQCDMESETREMWERLLDIAEWYLVTSKEGINSTDILLSVMRKGGIDEAIQAEKKYQEMVDERLIFIVKNRAYLWT